MVEVIEGDTPTLTVNFYNEADVLTSPASAVWKIVDIDTGEILMAETAISGIASSVDLTIPAAATVVVNNSRKYEKRKVIVTATFAGSRLKTGIYIFQVQNAEEV